ncbi:hypothetical protein K439DRAFT_1634166 [Ramaria rubella]|nr:hypothetical protein K439DRAFT_1634166 [Ramaria rubella]
MQRPQRNSSNAQGDVSAHDRIRDTYKVMWLSPRSEYKPPPTVKIDMHIDSGE